MSLEVEFLHPEVVVPALVWEFLRRTSIPDELFQSIGRMTVPWLVDEDAAHDSVAGAEAI